MLVLQHPASLTNRLGTAVVFYILHGHEPNLVATLAALPIGPTSIASTPHQEFPLYSKLPEFHSPVMRPTGTGLRPRIATHSHHTASILVATPAAASHPSLLPDAHPTPGFPLKSIIPTPENMESFGLDSWLMQYSLTQNYAFFVPTSTPTA